MKVSNFNFLKFCCIIILSIATSQLSAQEICDNGIDDDNDGMIDLNDTDCVCSDLMASSLIPNPSFEEMNCCPTNEAELNCADGWIQASTPTTDYVHECGVLGNPFLGFEAPLPFPDGQGGIGFRDGKPGQPNFKEYAGSCLTQAMTVGTEYRLDFFVGFHDAPGSMTFDMAIFGATQCTALPFGNFDENFGCPTNGPGWVELGAMTVNGENEWKNVVFDFVADQAYEAIVLGPACAINPNVNQDPYFFFDRLVLAESIMFEVPLADISGNICDDNLILTSSDGMGGTYQWYQDGIAIPNAIEQTLGLSNTAGVEGTYQVVVTTSTGCFNGEAYELTVPSYENTVEANFCEGGSIIIGGQEFDQAGTFELELTASDGCDSLVTLILESTAIMTGSLSFEGCQGETITVNNETYDATGNYTQNLISVDGCDSILSIQYLVLDNSSTDLSFQACNGEEVVVNGQSYTMSGQFTQLFTNSIGCDSILNISIVSAPSVSGVATFSICEGTGIDVNGQNFNQAGTFTQNLMSTSGCDSILTINITELENVTSLEQYTICQNEELALNGEIFTQAGSYQQFFTSTSGCDSILTIDVSVLENASSQLQFSICEDDPISINGQSYSAAGDYIQTLVSSNGCDSIINIMIFSSEVCSDCIFYEEFTSGSVVLSRIDEQNYMLGLVHGGQVKLNVEISYEAFSQFGAFYLVDNEVTLQGKKSKLLELMNGHTKIQDILSQCSWNENKNFSRAEVTNTLPYSSADLPGTINKSKLDLLYSNLMEQCAGLPVGGKMKINLR